jgi:hypothetical protein
MTDRYARLRPWLRLATALAITSRPTARSSR